MLHRGTPLVASLIACVILLTGVSADAADWDRFPDLEPRSHVAIETRFDGSRYDELRRYFRRFDLRVAMLKERLPTLDDELVALTQKVDDRFDSDHPFGDTLASRLASARTNLDRAKSLVEKEPRRAFSLADEAEAVLQPVRSKLERFNRDMSRLTDIEEDLSAIEAAIAKRSDRQSDQAQAASRKLAECRQQAKEIRTTNQGKPADVRDCLRAAETYLGKADVHSFYLRTVLPTLAIALLVVLLVGFLLVRRRRRQRALKWLEPALAKWRQHIDDATGRLDALEHEAPTYFSSSIARPGWQGDSARFDRQAANAANHLSLLIQRGRDILSRAESLYDQSHRLDARRLEQALDLLNETTIELEFQEPFRCQASELWGEVEVAERHVAEQIDAVNDITACLDEQSSRANRAAKHATQSVDLRGELGLTPEHLTEPLAAGIDTLQKARRQSPKDPLRAVETFEAAATQLDEVAQRAQRGNEIIRRVQGELATAGDELDEKIRKFRFFGINVRKLSFYPVQELEAAKRQAMRVVELVAEAREDEARQLLDKLQAEVDRLDERLEIVTQAREGVPKRIEQLTVRSESLKTRLLQTRYVLRVMGPDNQAKAFERESKTLGKYHARINRLPKLFAKAKEHHDEGRFLLASEEMDTVEAFFNVAESLVADLEGVDDKVEEARAQCKEWLSECEPVLRELQSRAKQDGVDAVLRTLIAEQAVSFQLVHDQIRAEQTSWLTARDELLSIKRVMVFLNDEIDVDLEAHEQAQAAGTKLDPEIALADDERTRVYREAKVRALTQRSASSEATAMGMLDNSLSWADSVATVDEPEGAF
jgi:predicted  nucleic acid-binding Zn-ribbon protein